MTRRARAAARLGTGSSALARQLGARTAAWIRRGHRDDLTGWRATLGCWLRLTVLGLVLYALWRVVRAVPALLWVLAGTWVVVAWRAGRPASAEEPAADESERSAPPDADAVRALLLDVMGDADTVHLRAVLTHLQEHGQWEGRTVTDLRARLDRLNIPHSRGVKVAGVPTWGARRRDLEAPSPAPAAGPSTEASTAA